METEPGSRDEAAELGPCLTAGRLLFPSALPFQPLLNGHRLYFPKIAHAKTTPHCALKTKAAPLFYTYKQYKMFINVRAVFCLQYIILLQANAKSSYIIFPILLCLQYIILFKCHYHSVISSSSFFNSEFSGMMVKSKCIESFKIRAIKKRDKCLNTGQ